ncbi:MAG: hypothetical protein ACREHD_03605 [Pirellulales bacterium]
METIGWGIGNLGLIAFIVGGIWFLVVAFQEEVPWGLACMFIPCVSIIFLVKFWDKASKPFGVQVAGFVAMIIGQAIRGEP